MAITYQALASVTISTATNEIEFTSISDAYTDLILKFSLRTTESQYYTDQGFRVTFNGTTSGYSNHLIYANNSSLGAQVNSSVAALQWVYGNGSLATASAFGTGEMYIPNYTRSTRKAVISDSSTELNDAANYVMAFMTGLTNITSTISSIKLATASGAGNFVQYSTATLYGVLKA